MIQTSKQKTEAALEQLKQVRLLAQQPGGPRAFFDSIGETLQPWQEELCEAVMDVRRYAAGIPTVTNHKGLPRISIRSCHGTGKTHGLAQVLHLWLFTTSALVPVTAPKQDQLKTRFWPRFRAILRHTPAWYKSQISVTSLRIKVNGSDDWGAVAETASEPENLAGYHDNPQLFLVDEASGQRLDPMFPTIEGALTTPGSVIVEIGNPTRSSGEFWSHHNKPKTADLYYKMHIKPEDSIYVSPDWLQSMATKYGKDSPVYKIRCRGEFVSQEAGQLINYAWLADSRERELVEDGSQSRLVISVDVAAGGDDFTVCEATRFFESCTHKIRMEKHSFDPEVASILTADAAIEMFERYGGDKDNPGEDMIVIDMMGVGNGAYNILFAKGYPVVGYAGGTSSDDPARWRNRRVQSYWAWHDDLQTGNVAYADDYSEDEDEWDDYVTQACSIRSRHGEERVEDLEPKEALIKRTHKSPDLADTTAMSYMSELPDIAKTGDNDAQAFGSLIFEGYDGGFL